jgi:hypothetical protein
MKALALIIALVATASADPKPDAKQLAADRASTAEKAFDIARKMMQQGMRTPDDVYRWGIRLLDAKLDGAHGKAIADALKEHADRMHDLGGDIEKMYKSGLASQLDQLTSSYFTLEADLWVARGKK